MSNEKEDKKSEEQIIDDILKEQIQEGKEALKEEKKNNTVSHIERRREKLEEYQKGEEARKSSESLKRRKNNLKAAVNRFQKRKIQSRLKSLSDNQLETFDSIKAREITNTVAAVVREVKITPEIEKMLFPYYIAGATIRSLHQQFGKKFGFSLPTLYNAKDFYLWEQRKAAIRKRVMTDSDSAITTRMKDYVSFIDDLLSEAIIRFKDNSDGGQNNSPFNNLKINNIKDIKDSIELLYTMLNGGTKKIDLNSTENVNVNVKIDGSKRSKILAALAEEDEDEEIIEAEYKDIDDNDNND